MSTPSERLEAEIWLEVTDPDLPEAQREAFLAAVDGYYAENPTADRSPHFLSMLREDNLAFAKILDSVRAHVPGTRKRGNQGES
ncbi:hypothetical protein ACTXL6_21385 [Brachybacterium tyrofermentans]|uniref:hypothetical protein n=2 Tax=Brachybacterium tyrofermentans TaxID=47848 RepID=UPI003FD20F1E